MTLPQDQIASTFTAPGKIVVATDLTDTEYLLPHAIAQAKASGASLILTHAVLPHESMPFETGAIPYYDPLRMDRAARLMLGPHGHRPLKKFVPGSVARQLLETVEVPVCTVGPRAHKRTPGSPGTI